MLTGIKQNSNIIRLPNGDIRCGITFHKGKHILETGASRNPEGSVRLAGFQLRYVYFLSEAARRRLAVPVLPYSRIDDLGAGMYRGVKRAGSIANDVPPYQGGEGGATPTPALQK